MIKLLKGDKKIQNTKKLYLNTLNKLFPHLMPFSTVDEMTLSQYVDVSMVNSDELDEINLKLGEKNIKLLNSFVMKTVNIL
jgi:hypothetical protein